MPRIIMLLVALSAAIGVSCSKPMMSAKRVPHLDYHAQKFEAVPNDVYYAVREAMGHAGYSVSNENLHQGVIFSTWVAATSDSHYIDVFGRHDYAPNGAYHQLEIQIASEEGGSRLKIASHMKSLSPKLRSSGREEKKLLAKVANALRKNEPEITNLGIEE